MRDLSRFVIRNDFGEPAFLSIEPEGHSLTLANGEEVSVIDEFASHPATVKCSKTSEGGLILSIWPGDGEVRVERDGVDVLDLETQTGSTFIPVAGARTHGIES